MTNTKILPPDSSVQPFVEVKSRPELRASAFAHMPIPGGRSEGPGAPRVVGVWGECRVYWSDSRQDKGEQSEML